MHQGSGYTCLVESWAQCCPQLVIAAHSTCAGSPSAFDHVAAFTAKLALHSINRPNADAISRLLRHFPQQMLMMILSAGLGSLATVYKQLYILMPVAKEKFAALKFQVSHQPHAYSTSIGS